MVAGLAAIFLSTSALFGLLAGGAPAVGGEHAEMVTQLPISRAPLSEVAARGESNEGSLKRSLESALSDRSAAAGRRRGDDQPSSSW
jgi:hypothetical protein